MKTFGIIILLIFCMGIFAVGVFKEFLIVYSLYKYVFGD